MRILLVDDDAGLRALLPTTFEAVDVELEEADDAPAATEAVRRSPRGRRPRRANAGEAAWISAAT
jgi:DNA-binding response OmpR family regulator